MKLMDSSLAQSLPLAGVTLVKIGDGGGGGSNKWLLIGIGSILSFTAIGLGFYFLRYNHERKETLASKMASSVQVKNSNSGSRKASGDGTNYELSMAGEDVGVDLRLPMPLEKKTSSRGHVTILLTEEESPQQAAFNDSLQNSNHHKYINHFPTHDELKAADSWPELPETSSLSRMMASSSSMVDDEENMLNSSITEQPSPSSGSLAFSSGHLLEDPSVRVPLEPRPPEEEAILDNVMEVTSQTPFVASVLPTPPLVSPLVSGEGSSSDSNSPSKQSDKREHIGWVGVPILANIPGLHEYVTKLKLAFQTHAIDEETLLLLKQLFFVDASEESHIPFLNVPCARRFENILDLLHMRLKTSSGQSIISLLFGSTICFTVLCDDCETASVITYRRLMWKIPLSSPDFKINTAAIQNVLHQHHTQASFPGEAFRCQHKDQLNYINTTILSLPSVLVLQFYPKRGSKGWPKDYPFGLTTPNAQIDLNELVRDADGTYNLIAACCAEETSDGKLLHRQYFQFIRNGEWRVHELGQTNRLQSSPVDDPDFRPHVLVYARSDFTTSNTKGCFYYRLAYDLMLDQESVTRGTTPLQQDWPPEMWSADPEVVNSAAHLAPLHFFTNKSTESSIAYSVLHCLLHTPGLKDCYLDVDPQRIRHPFEQAFRSLFHQMNLSGEFDASRFLQQLRMVGDQGEQPSTPFHFTTDVLASLMRLSPATLPLCNFIFHLKSKVRRICAVCNRETKANRDDDLYITPFKIPEELNPCGIQQCLPLNFWSKTSKIKSNCRAHRYYWKVLDSIERSPRVLIFALKQMAPYKRRKQIFLDFQLDIQDFCFDDNCRSTQYQLYAVCSQIPGLESFSALVRNPNDQEPAWKRYQHGTVSTINEKHKIMSICNTERALLFYVNCDFREPFHDPDFAKLHQTFLNGKII